MYCQLVQPGLILKQGVKVRPSEEKAMSLVQKHTPSIPVPNVHGWSYKYKDTIPYYGELLMDYVPGQTLKDAWAGMDDQGKARICQDIWDIVAVLRTIPRPDDLEPGMYRTVDGSRSYDPLLGSSRDVAPRDMDDKTLRERIYARFVATNGLSYKDVDDLPESLPHSSESVFVHGDIGPRNIIVDENGRIKALLDWESSGWYPDYWEYMQMMTFCHPLEYEWQKWMTATRPVQWDISGIQKARRVLF